MVNTNKTEGKTSTESVGVTETQRIVYPETKVYEDKTGKLVIELRLTEYQKDKLLVESGMQKGRARYIWKVDVVEIDKVGRGDQ